VLHRHILRQVLADSHQVLVNEAEIKDLFRDAFDVALVKCQLSQLEIAMHELNQRQQRVLTTDHEEAKVDERVFKHALL